MYNFNLMEDEILINVFDDILIKQEENEKTTTIALTDKRLLFLDYIITNDGLETLRIVKGLNYIRSKDVYYQINLNDIDIITHDKYYKVTLKNKTTFEFNNNELFNLLNNNILRI